MRVAIVGAGSFAKHFVDELPKAGHEVVLLTRSHKSAFDDKRGLLEQRVTDYSSVDQLTTLLHDCDAVVVTVYETSQAFVDLHVALIEACKKTPKCKRFIPSEFGGNTEDFPEPPGSSGQYARAVKDALRAQSELEWTVISNGWLADYVVPAANRYHPDLGPLFAIDFATKTMTIPGTGHEKFAVTSARDIAAAVTQLLLSKTKWRPFTYVQGELTSWLEIAEVMRTTGGMGDELKVTFESVEELRAVVEANESHESMLLAEFKLFVPSGELHFDQAKVKRDRDEFFPNVRLRSVRDLVDAAKSDPTIII